MISIDDVIQGIWDILREEITSTDKIEKLQNFILSVEESLEEGR